MYIPGKDHVTHDAFSRRSDSPVLRFKPPEQRLDLLKTTTNNVSPGYSETFGPPSWVSQPSVCAVIARMAVSAPTTEELNGANRLEEFMMGKALAL